jgi:hypothetical protein
MDWKIVVAAPLVAWLVVANAAALKMPINWRSDAHAPNSRSYLLGIDPEVNFNGKPALAVRSMEHVGPLSFAAATRYLDAFGYEGRHVSFSGMLKTSDASTWAGVFLSPVSDIAERDWIFADLQSVPHASAPTVGTSDWHPVDVVIAVPRTPGASISFGLAVVGDGQAWVSDLKFEEVSDDVPLTETRIGIDVDELARQRAR